MQRTRPRLQDWTGTLLGTFRRLTMLPDAFILPFGTFHDEDDFCWQHPMILFVFRGRTTAEGRQLLASVAKTNVKSFGNDRQLVYNRDAHVVRN